MRLHQHPLFVTNHKSIIQHSSIPFGSLNQKSAKRGILNINRPYIMYCRTEGDNPSCLVNRLAQRAEMCGISAFADLRPIGGGLSHPAVRNGGLDLEWPRSAPLDRAASQGLRAPRLAAWHLKGYGPIPAAAGWRHPSRFVRRGARRPAVSSPARPQFPYRHGAAGQSGASGIQLVLS